ncbi:MAG TPA: ABC transporter permease [Gemmatimonadaceae bacterium]
MPYPLYGELAREVRSVEGLAGYHVMEIGARIGDRVVQVEIAGVYGNFFDVLGLRPQAGRLLHASDDGPVGGNPVVVLSDAAWLRFFARQPEAIGSTVRAGGRSYTIVGVAPARFRGTDLTVSPQLWFPIQMSTSLGEGGLFSGRSGGAVFETTAFGWVELVGRLREGVAWDAAASELNAKTLAYWGESRSTSSTWDSTRACWDSTSLRRSWRPSSSGCSPRYAQVVRERLPGCADTAGTPRGVLAVGWSSLRRRSRFCSSSAPAFSSAACRRA